MSTHHHHIKADIFTGLPEAVVVMKKHGELWRIQGPFKYCPICKCIPTKFVGRNPEEDVKDEHFQKPRQDT